MQELLVLMLIIPITLVLGLIANLLIRYSHEDLSRKGDDF